MNVCDTYGCDRVIPDDYGAFCNEHAELVAEELANRRDEFWDDDDKWSFVEVDCG